MRVMSDNCASKAMVRIDCFIIILNQVGVVVVKSGLVQIKKEKLKCYVFMDYIKLNLYIVNSKFKGFHIN